MDISPKEVVFNPPFEEVSNTTIKLTNTTNEPLIYKVKTTSPSVYCVRPNASTVEAGKSREILITRQSKAVTPGEQSKDKFMILSAGVDSKRFGHIDSVPEIWSIIERGHSSNAISAQKLRVSFSGNSSSGSQQQKSSQGSQSTAGDYSTSGNNGAAAAAGGAGAAGVAGAGAASYGSSHDSSRGTQYSGHNGAGDLSSNQVFSSPQSATRGNSSLPTGQEYQSQAGAYTSDSKAQGVSGTAPNGGSHAGSAGSGALGAGAGAAGAGAAGAGAAGSQQGTPSRGGYESYSPSQGTKGHQSHDSGDYDLSRKDYSVKNSSRSQTGGNDFNDSNDYASKSSKGQDAQSYEGKSSKLGGDGSSSLHKQTSGHSGAISTGSGPDGVVTVDDIQGTPGVPPKSQLIDEGDAKTGPKLANSKLPDGPKPDRGLKSDKEHGDKEDTDKEHGESTKSAIADKDPKSSDFTANKRSGSNSSYDTSNSQGYLASAQETAGQYASSAAGAAGAAAGAAAGVAGVAASQVSNWFNGSPDGQNQNQTRSQTQPQNLRDTRAVTSDVPSSHSSQSSKNQGSYAGGFESIVNGGGFEAAPASNAAERSIAGGPKTEQYSSSPYAAGSQGGAHHTHTNHSGAGNYDSSYSPSRDSNTSRNVAGAGTGAGLGAGAGALASQAESHSQANKQTSKYPSDLSDKASTAYDQHKSNFENSSKQATSDIKGNVNDSKIGSGSYGSHNSGPQGYDARSTSSGSYGDSGTKSGTYSGSHSGKSDATYGAGAGAGVGALGGAATAASKDAKNGDYNSASNEFKSAAHNKASDVEDRFDPKLSNRSNNDSYSSSSNQGYTSSSHSGLHNNLNQNSTSPSTGYSSSRSANGTGFDSTVNSTAASVGGAYSSQDPTTTTLHRDSHASAAPNVPSGKQSEVPLNVTVLLVVLAFLVGWKFF